MTPIQIYIIIVAVVTVTMTAIARPILRTHTVSMALRDWAKTWTWIPFVFGFLLGHWFGPVNYHWEYASVVWLIPLLGIVIGLDVWCLKKNIVKTKILHWRWPLWWVFPGMVSGLIFWPQIG